MNLAKRIESIGESVTLKLNAKANQLAEEGKKIYNLTAGQLPFRPPKEFVQGIRGELDFLGSFQYSPVAGDNKLREKILDYFQLSRGVNLEDVDCDFATIVGNGGKHVISNIFATLVNPGDEVVLIAPYWVSYPEMINIYEGQTKIVKTDIFNAFTPSLEDIDNAITDKTKVIVINSPNNPSGNHYSDEWMKDFAKLMQKYPDVFIISDEIYFELNYFDPAPTYFYQHDSSLLERTIIVDGISKNLASTGLRIGYAIGNKEVIQAMSKIQSHTASGSCSLIQKALLKFDMSQIKEYLTPIKNHLRDNSLIVREKFREAKLDKCWYQTHSAFYYMVDFSQCPVIEKHRKGEDDKTDYSSLLCEEILDKYGVAMVPGEAFGTPNCARISLVLPKDSFDEAMGRIIEFLVG
ncbi:pyridoxal phosphate-dependent aminotransferase [Bacteriovorax sp. DB6_IX]|uniref:pyridoxal phosphate-dependent aminotransferase n=1 Tax=Bacteriovorax sp. DB6_IX TaxID=1353530 RepID=UPI00038A1128|nr:aminotransferase class I/II-fold pyridoxal phosphate-dependent enzyme [Bacteriovorax sp. DB6_IX]EQC50555.1 aminotransferase, class I/II [Bacteriovorax sp. DB6_IX]